MDETERVKDCFSKALQDEAKGKKHKGLLVVDADMRGAEAYLEKARKNLEICDLFKQQGFDYKIPEEWFYTMYYCALAILARFGVESRSQRCTAHLLRYLKEKGLIVYDDEFIDRITVYSDKDSRSDVDVREQARYGTSVRSEEVIAKYEFMTDLCKRCISQCEVVVYSEGKYGLPKDLFL